MLARCIMAVIGVDIGGSKIAAGIVKKKRVLKKIVVPTPQTKKVLIDSIIEVISQFSDEKIKGIGIGVAGHIDKKGNWLKSPNIACVKNLPLKKIIEKRFRKKARINNDANCFALAEAIHGRGRNKKIVFGLILGTGTGGGIIIDKRIIEGSDFMAGEIGAIPYKESHVELYCSGKFIKRMARKYRLTKTSPKEVDEMAKSNSKAKRIYEQFGDHVGYLLFVVIQILDPDIIVIGGGLSKAWPLFSKNMFRFRYLHGKPRTKVVRSKLGGDAGIIGAAALAEQ